MPTPRPIARVRGRHVAAAAMASVALAIFGCPSNAPGGGPGISGVQAPSTKTGSPSTSGTPGPTIPPVIVTPIPSSSGGGPVQNATPPPQSLFATPTPTPTPQPTPTLEPLDLKIFEGSGTSNFAFNLFVVPASGDLPHLDPPSTRSYSAFNDIGIGPTLASTSGVPQVTVSTSSVPANWSITGVATIDVRPAGVSIPPIADLVFFRLPGGATASTVAATDTVEVDVATVSTGVLLTLSADVNSQTGQTFDGGATNSATVQVLGSNEGQVSFTVSSLRQVQFERVTP